MTCFKSIYLQEMKQNAQMGQVQEQVSHLDVQVQEYYFSLI